MSDAVFETERLVVRDWAPGDAERMYDMYSRDDVVRFLGAAPSPMPSLEAAGERITRGELRNGEARAAGTPFGWWAAEVRESGVVAGSIALVQIDGSREPDAPVEVAWALHPDAHGHGFATEGARGALERGHEAGLKEILALIDEANAPSQGVARRLGLELTGVTEEFYGKPLMVWVSRRSS
ncbi:MAG TPA: GNAT family N-acetyltransferase [Actinomycetes bacterium]|jgi:RimJ/RimL family protein N-acetyltransferase